MKLILTLPLPPSDNRRLTANHRPTPEYDRWKDRARLHWNDLLYNLEPGTFWEMDSPSYDIQYTYIIRIFMKDQKGDFTNFLKCLKDFGSKRIYTDDKWVNMLITMPVLLDRDNPRVEWDLDPLLHHRKANQGNLEGQEEY